MSFIKPINHHPRLEKNKLDLLEETTKELYQLMLVVVMIQ